jgi:ATP-dependent 26S proteasome regulatory subunit
VKHRAGPTVRDEDRPVTRAPLLVVFGGLPGTGKTTLTARIAAQLPAAYLRIDAIEALR